MDTRHKPFIIVIVLGVVGFMFWLYAPSFQNARQAAQGDALPNSALDQLPPPPPPPPVPGNVAPYIISATDTITGGNKHTLKGTIEKANACDTLTTAVSVSKTKPEEVMLSFITKPATTANCTKTETKESFSISFTAGRDALLEATLNGQEADLHLPEVE